MRTPRLDENAKKVALINAYNALTVRWIVSNFPVKSIWRTKDPFRVARHQVNGVAESLDSIETRLRNMRDPRIHGALVCAARSCPPLRREPYTREAVDGQLDDNFRVWLADPDKTQFLPENHLAKVSKIFEWYAADFAAVGGVPAVLEKFAPPRAFAPANKLEYLKYSWGLNDNGSWGDSYSGFEFYIDYVRNGYMRADIGVGFLDSAASRRDSLLFAIDRLACPELTQQATSNCAAAGVGLFFISAYLYLLIAGKNIPAWVYVVIVVLLGLGAGSTVRKVRTGVVAKEHSAGKRISIRW